MQESRKSSVDRSLPGSIFQKFENIYNEEDQQLKKNDKARKILLAQIMSRQQQINNQHKQMKRQFTERENKEIDLFWRNQQERLRNIQRKRREQIEEARQVNNSNFRQILSKSMNVDSYHLQKSFRDDLATFQEKQRLKKQNAQKFLQQGLIAQQARQQKKQYDRELDLIIAQQKEKEDKELNMRREQYFSNWKSKHFQEKHPNTVKLVSQINQRNQADKAQLEEIIAVKGGYQLNQRVAALRGMELEQRNAKKEDYTRQIKGQIQQNTYKAAIDRYLQLNYERKRMQEMGKVLQEKDLKEKQQKKEIHNQHLNVLKNQFKPRVLLQQPDKIQAAGIGSPAHIGKIIHDDRIKQLKYIERSYLHQLNHL